MNKKVIAISAVAAIVFLGAGVWWLFSSGRLAWTDPATKMVTVKPVCAKADVDKYNDAMFYIARKGETTPTLDIAALKDLVVAIEKKSNYENDATCQTILFWIAVQNDEYDNAKKAYTAVKSLHESYKFADSNLRTNEPLFRFEETLNGLSGSGVPVSEKAPGE